MCDFQKFGFDSQQISNRSQITLMLHCFDILCLWATMWVYICSALLLSGILVMSVLRDTTLPRNILLSCWCPPITLSHWPKNLSCGQCECVQATSATPVTSSVASGDIIRDLRAAFLVFKWCLIWFNDTVCGPFVKYIVTLMTQIRIRNRSNCVYRKCELDLLPMLHLVVFGS